MYNMHGKWLKKYNTNTVHVCAIYILENFHARLIALVAAHLRNAMCIICVCVSVRKVYNVRKKDFLYIGITNI